MDKVNAERNMAAKREIFQQETLAAWEDYKETGHSITQDEMEAWAFRLETEYSG